MVVRDLISILQLNEKQSTQSNSPQRLLPLMSTVTTATTSKSSRVSSFPFHYVIAEDSTPGNRLK